MRPYEKKYYSADVRMIFAHLCNGGARRLKSRAWCSIEADGQLRKTVLEGGRTRAMAGGAPASEMPRPPALPQSACKESTREPESLPC